MYCINCGSEIAKNSEFCHKCGSKVTVADAVKKSDVDEKFEAENKPSVNEEKPVQRKKHRRFIKFLSIFGLIFVGLVFIFNMFNSVKNSISPTEDGLRNFVNEIYTKDAAKDYAYMYDNFYSPESKAIITKTEFIDASSKVDEKYKLIDIKIENVIVRGNTGYVYRTRTVCILPDCTEKRPRKQYRKYIFIGNRWYVSSDKDIIYCLRETPYANPPEFDRAVSLIIQRMGQSAEVGAADKAKDFKAFKNCLNIQYAPTDAELSSAEGVFSYVPSQSPEKLDILVSPRYKVKDDLITAILLSHEMEHVYRFLLDLNTGTTTPCFDNEADAFSFQIGIMKNLNKEELDSLKSRAVTDPSEELSNIILTAAEVALQPGKDAYEKHLNRVKSDPFYQKQCAGK